MLTFFIIVGYSSFKFLTNKYIMLVKIISSVIFITFSAFPFVMQYFLKNKYKKLTEELKQPDSFYHQCIFTNMNNFECRQHVTNRDECSDHCSFRNLCTLMNFISSAKLSISLCMYTWTLKQINVELMKAHKRGVRVRIITDKGMQRTDVAKANTSFLRARGVPVKIQPCEESFMHHKFCLIDKEDKESAKMFFGSMNLTMQGLVANFENIILTNNLNMIERFSEEFELLWEEFH